MGSSQRKATERPPSDYAREALSEWRKAARYGAQAVAPAIRSATSTATEYARHRLDLSLPSAEKGGGVGALADAALSRLGVAGKLGSKLSLGSRLVESARTRPPTKSGGKGDDGQAGAAEPASNGNGFKAETPIPIQESIEVTIPVGAAYALATAFEDYPEFLDRVERAEVIDDDHVAFVVRVRGRSRELEVEIVDERPNQRIDWVCTGGIPHSGVISFHELAPRLTHIELTVELEPEGIVERLTRSAHLSGRAVRTELHRFKAYADLWEEPVDEEPLDEEDLQDEGPVDEEEVDDEEYEDEEELEDEEGPVDEEEEYEEDEELEPAGADR
jgi:uncharacterized membrane protein